MHPLHHSRKTSTGNLSCVTPERLSVRLELQTTGTFCLHEAPLYGQERCGGGGGSCQNHGSEGAGWTEQAWLQLMRCALYQTPGVPANFRGQELHPELLEDRGQSPVIGGSSPEDLGLGMPWASPSQAQIGQAQPRPKSWPEEGLGLGLGFEEPEPAA
ncbi:hypothetical protein DFH29DRAFT_1031008 [Suillus ampliporus]|nr:hypothetical protein DFH29DRAFT_1031008 [Suillus ampliporus]